MESRSDIAKRSGPTRARIAQLGLRMLERGLTDIAGGNLSARIPPGDSAAWCMTPRYAGHRWHWRLRAPDVLVLDPEGRVLLGEGEPSRDVEVHRDIYHAIPTAQAVVHAHAPWCLVFATLGRPIPARIAASVPLGDSPVLDDRDVEGVLRSLADRAERISSFATAVIQRNHGVLVVGRDLRHAYDALERLEANARTIARMELLQSGRGAPMNALAPRIV